MHALSILFFSVCFFAAASAQFYNEETKKIISGCPPGVLVYQDFGFKVHYECNQDGKEVLIGCTIDGYLYEPNEEATVDYIRSRMCVQKPDAFIRNEIIGCVSDEGVLLTTTDTISNKDGTAFGCYVKKDASGRIVKAKWFRKARAYK
ncbi:hypothetical protein L596_015661 [Steinernema carpocapsae]|uniref:Ig-like domain-containing protein n=1 Tax=Steinernema carpocapsae TaxID=34508 RepID=A0A4U5NGH9_STECR|nr:hypothetical protein L596_015661 [Steinernema carpocapsae]